MKKLAKTLKIGIIQTNVDNRTAWFEDGIVKPHMNEFAAQKVMDEIRRGFKDLLDRTEPPQIVLIPEYSIPHNGIKCLERYAITSNAVVIGGLDLIQKDNYAFNKGILIIPNRWAQTGKSYICNKYYFGKAFFSDYELTWYKQCKLNPVSELETYIIDASEYGRIGIAICSDFYDIERFVLYKGKVHHLFIISYNKDYKSFEFLAEAISRLLLCNVIICNTGNYGDSLAYSPYKQEHERTIYKNAGHNLFSSQLIELPVSSLDEDQTLAHQRFEEGIEIDSTKATFKWPPGYKKLGN